MHLICWSFIELEVFTTSIEIPTLITPVEVQVHNMFSTLFPISEESEDELLDEIAGTTCESLSRSDNNVRRLIRINLSLRLPIRGGLRYWCDRLH
jgi:hypothetical protein